MGASGLLPLHNPTGALSALTDLNMTSADSSSSPPASKAFPTIVKIETFIPAHGGDGGDYHRQKEGHWIIDTPISNPMSGYEKYRHSRTTWGIGVLGSLVVVITASDGTQ